MRNGSRIRPRGDRRGGGVHGWGSNHRFGNNGGGGICGNNRVTDDIRPVLVADGGRYHYGGGIREGRTGKHAGPGRHDGQES